MPHRSLKPIHCGLLAAAAGLLLGAGSAAAQGYGGYGPTAYSGPPEEVIVIAPRERRIQEQGGSLDFPPNKVSLSTRVRYDDLDLLSWDGAQTLRMRVREAARHVCRHLAEAYPFQRLSTSPGCYRETVESGMVHADEAINIAREDYLYGYE
jgi:UrcA family protein